MTFNAIAISVENQGRVSRGSWPWRVWALCWARIDGVGAVGVDIRGLIVYLLLA